MSVKKPTLIDKSSWPAGPWKDEPDQITWIDEISGYRCLMIRHPDHCAWCGYVGVPSGHALWGKSYHHRVKMERAEVELPDTNDILGIFSEAMCHHDDGTVPLKFALKVHANVSFADLHEGYEDWFFGFGCCMPGDIHLMAHWEMYRRVMGVDFLLKSVSEEGVYRDVKYVMDQCHQLAAQLFARK